MSNLGGNSPSADTDKSNNLVGPPGPAGADSTVPGPPGADSTVPGPPGVDGIVASVVGGTNATVDNTDPANPIVNAEGQVESVVGGTNATIDNTDPKNPIINVSVASSPTTTKGDTIARGASVDERVAVGTDGQVLTADAASASGVKWVTPAAGGGGNAFEDLATDTNYAMMGMIGQSSTQRTDAALSANFVYFDFIFFDGVTTVNQIACNSATTATAGTIEIGLHPVTSRLSIGDQSYTGTITTTATANAKFTVAVSFTPAKGWYAIAMHTTSTISNIVSAFATTSSGMAKFFPAYAYSTAGDAETEMATMAMKKTGYQATPDLSAIDFNDIGIYDSVAEDELIGNSSVPIIEFRSA